MTRRTGVTLAVSVVGLIAVTAGVGRLTDPRPTPRPEPEPVGLVARMGDDRLIHPSRESGGRTLAFVLGGRAILSAGNGIVYLFDAGTGRLLHSYGRSLDRPWPSVAAAGVLPDGTRAVFFETPPGGPGHVVVWDLARWREVERTAFDPGRLRPDAFSPDGRYFVGIDPSGGGRVVCDLAERVRPAAEQYWTHVPAARYVPAGHAVAFTPDGREFVAGWNRVEVYDAAAGRVARDFGELPKIPADKARGDITDEPMPVILGAAAVSPDGRWLAETGAFHPWIFGPYAAEGVIRVRDLRTGQVVRTIPAGGVRPGSGTKRSMPRFDRFAFTPGGARLLVAGADGRLATWSLDTGRKVAEWPIRDGVMIRFNPVPDALAVSPDGKRVATASGSVIRVWDAATGRELAPRTGHAGGVTSLAFTADGGTLYTLGADCRLFTWDAATGWLRRAGGELPFGWDLPRITPDARWLVTTTADKDYKPAGLQLRDPATGEVRLALPPRGVVPIPGRDEAVRFEDADVVVGPLAGGPPRVRYRTRGNLPEAHPFPDGKRLLTREYYRGPFAVLDLDTGATVARWELPIAGLRGAGPRTKVSFFGFGPVAVGPAVVAVPLDLEGLPRESPSHRVAVCDAMTGALLWEHVCERRPYHYYWYDTPAFSPGGRRVAIGGDRVTLYDAATGRELAAFDGHRGGVSALAFSPDGTRLASGGHDGTAIVWDVAGK